MNKSLFLSGLTVILAALAGCASPAFNMTDAEVASLSDDQLCAFANNYRKEARTELEIARRGLNCNRHHRQCLRRGNQPGTEAMRFCEEVLRENERLRSYPVHADPFWYHHGYHYAPYRGGYRYRH